MLLSLFNLSGLLGLQYCFHLNDLLFLSIFSLALFGRGQFILGELVDFLLNLFEGPLGFCCLFNLVPSVLATSGKLTANSLEYG